MGGYPQKPARFGRELRAVFVVATAVMDPPADRIIEDIQWRAKMIPGLAITRVLNYLALKARRATVAGSPVP